MSSTTTEESASDLDIGVEEDDEPETVTRQMSNVLLDGLDGLLGKIIICIR
jgi:hypothetical protein